jgi:restriction endonuclease S subunit
VEKVSIVPENFPEKALVTGSVYKMTMTEEMDKHTVLAYLISKYGKAFKDRFKTNLLISFLSKDDLYRIPIPKFSKDFQKHVKKLFAHIFILNTQSKEAYAEAEAVLLEELGLADFTPSIEAVSIKGFTESFGSTGRLDAEYYQPKYDQLLARIRSFEWGYQKLKTKGFFQNGSLISDEFYTNVGERAYLRIKELSLNLPIQDDKVVFIDNKFVMNNETTVKTNDFIIATIGNTIGKVNLIHEKYNGSFISNNTSKFSLYSNEEAFYYWEVLLRSFIVQEQIQREFTQTAQPKISNSSLEEIIVPIIQKETQQKISKLAERSLILKAQSEGLLAIAKRGVELAIESDEASAQAWMLEQSGGLLASHDV